MICKEKKVPGLGFAKLYPLEAILKAIFFVQKRVESNSRERNEFKMVLERERGEYIVPGKWKSRSEIEVDFIFKRWNSALFFGVFNFSCCRYQTVHFHVYVLSVCVGFFEVYLGHAWHGIFYKFFYKTRQNWIWAP